MTNTPINRPYIATSQPSHGPTHIRKGSLFSFAQFFPLSSSSWEASAANPCNSRYYREKKTFVNAQDEIFFDFLTQKESLSVLCVMWLVCESSLPSVLPEESRYVRWRRRWKAKKSCNETFSFFTLVLLGKQLNRKCWKEKERERTKWNCTNISLTEI